LFSYLGIRQNLLHFSLSANEPKKVESVHLENFHGMLEGTNTGTANPIIAIVTHYDSFGIISDIPAGLNSNGSGVITLLELVRILSKFYENYESVIKYDLLFVLTSGGNLNFEGTQQFINTLDASIQDNLQYVLCLDSLAGGPDLYLHASRFPKEHEENARKLHRVNIYMDHV
jgi:Zn-dependent M28 family amino/carboxypeptidase